MHQGVSEPGQQVSLCTVFQEVEMETFIRIVQRGKASALHDTRKEKEVLTLLQPTNNKAFLYNFQVLFLLLFHCHSFLFIYLLFYFIHFFVAMEKALDLIRFNLLCYCL